MLVSAKLMSDALAKAKPLLVDGGAGAKDKIIMCMVKGDLHDIGKNLVTMLLEGAGFMGHDLGINVTVEEVAEKANEVSPELLGLSTLLTKTLTEMRKVIQLLNQAGIRDQVNVMVDGAPADQRMRIARFLQNWVARLHGVGTH